MCNCNLTDGLIDQSQPMRIQRKRTKGWRMPCNTMYVGRPGKWGNPFKVMGDVIYINAWYRIKTLEKWVFYCYGDVKNAVKLYKTLFDGNAEDYADPDLKYWINHFSDLDLSELKGKNLACFCSIDKPCHADILLKLSLCSKK